MSDLRTLAQPLLDQPPVPRQSIASIEHHARARRRRHAAMTGAAFIGVCLVGLIALAGLRGNGNAAVVRAAQQPTQHLVNGPIYPTRAEEQGIFCDPANSAPGATAPGRRDLCKLEKDLSPYPDRLLQKLGIELSGRGFLDKKTKAQRLVPEYRRQVTKLVNGVPIHSTAKKLMRFTEVKKIVDKYYRAHEVPTRDAFAWGDHTKRCTDGGITIGVTVDGPGGKGLCVGFYQLAGDQFWRLSVDGVLQPPNQCGPTPEGYQYLSTYDWKWDTAAGTTTVYGQAAPDATRIELTTKSGKTYVIDPFYVNSSLGINLFAARLPTTESIETYKSFDANGTAIVPGGSPGICGPPNL